MIASARFTADRTPDLVFRRERIRRPGKNGGDIDVIYVEARTAAGREWHEKTKRPDVNASADGFLIHPAALPVLLSARDEGLVVEEDRS